ncbi:S26 family signal peptidase [Halorussus salinus]|uniref:S26 family signal peptidase n=1 Tax=Halorussus salinus TaxID=1364935 RepID=UPI001091D322|nr:S26 family signal peptidase [Halorussus salinus]
MGVQRILLRSVEIVVVVLIVGLFAGPLLGQPIVLGYVETGSMQPTLEPGDGFVAIPAQLSGPIESGDVVTFHARKLHDGSLTTHRVVGRTAEGFVTRGDNNLFTDQQAGEPPVRRSQIVAVALQVNGRVVVVPNLGMIADGTQSALSSVQETVTEFFGLESSLGMRGLAYLLFALSAIGYILDAWLDGTTRRRDRNTTRNSGYSALLILLALAVIIVSVAAASMLLTSGPQSVPFDSVDPSSPSEGGIPAGANETVTLNLSNAGYVPVVAFVESRSGGLTVQDHHVSIGPNSQRGVRVTLSAPDKPGRYYRTMVVHRYLAILPVSVIRILYVAHPLLPVVVINGLLGGTVAILGITLVGRGRVRFDQQRNGLPLVTALRRWVRWLYW